MAGQTAINDLPASLRDDLVMEHVTSGEIGLFALVIPARAEYNGTRVQCVAESDDGHSVASDTAILTVQGTLYYTMH